MHLSIEIGDRTRDLMRQGRARAHCATLASISTALYVMRKEPGTQTYHVILPSCGSSGKADYQNVLPYRDRWLLIERKLKASIFIRLEPRAHMESQPAFIQSSDKLP